MVRESLGRITKDEVDKIRQLYEMGYTKSEIARKLNVSRGTVRKYVRNEYPEKGKGAPPLLEKERKPILEEFRAFKMKGELKCVCKELLRMLDMLGGEEGDLIKDRVLFIKKKVEEESNIEALKKLEVILESERGEVEALLEERGKRVAEEKRAWMMRKCIELGMSEEEAREELRKMEKNVKDGLEGLYRVARELDRIEKVKDECLKYMSLEDYNRISTLFLESLPDAEYLLNFWRQEKDIVATYGWGELLRFYQTHRSSIVKNKPQLKKAFIDYLQVRGLQPCPYCNLLIYTVGAPPQFLCPRCHLPVRRVIQPMSLSIDQS